MSRLAPAKRLHLWFSRVNRRFIKMPDIWLRASSPMAFFGKSCDPMLFVRSSMAVIPLMIGVLIGVGESGGARAEESHAYVIAADDGYGLSECLADSGECGQVVADAWCEAHGHGSAQSYGPQSRFVGVVKISTVAEPFVVNCRD